MRVTVFLCDNGVYGAGEIGRRRWVGIEFSRTTAAGLVEEKTTEEGAAGVVALAMCPLPLVVFRRRQRVLCGWNEMFIVHLNEKESFK